MPITAELTEEETSLIILTLQHTTVPPNVREKLDLIITKLQTIYDHSHRIYPRGKIIPSDEGEISTRIGTQGNSVIVDFGKSIVWIGFGADEAREFASVLIAKADAIEAAGKKGNGE